MFEWILFGLIAAVTVAACITIDTLREAMDKAKIDNGEIIAFMKGAKKVVKLQDLESRLQIEVTGDDISDDLYVGQKIRRKPVSTLDKKILEAIETIETHGNRVSMSELQRPSELDEIVL